MLIRVALIYSFLLSMLLFSSAGLASSVNKPWPAKKPLPAFELTDLDGKTWRTADLKGRVTVLNFWATWCEPCREEMPALMQLAKAHPADKLQVLTVNYQESPEKVRRFMEAGQLVMPTLLDRDGAAARAWTGRIFPTTVVIDSTGRPRFTVTGEFDWVSEEAARLLAPLLAPSLR